MPLEPEDLQHLRAAQGYEELGMWLEADAELDQIDPFCRALPEVLAIRLEISRGLQKWDLMRVLAEKLAECDPNEPQWAIARRLCHPAGGVDPGGPRDPEGGAPAASG